MGEILNSTKGVKSGVPKRVSISCPICGRGVKFVNKVCKLYDDQISEK